MSRPSGRRPDELRELEIQPDYLEQANGSALISFGKTRVLCTASIEEGVPRWLAGRGRGWLTAEYSMLPRATHTRTSREVAQGRPSGRTAEIQRLIGRSLRAAVDLTAMPDKTLVLDCDVLQADGGTRTAGVTAAYVAAGLALARLYLTGDIPEWPLLAPLAAVSVGLVGGVPLLDLEYVEDQVAEVDMNVVATADGTLVEIQGTGERRSFRRDEMDALVDLALKGIGELADAQRAALATALEEVAAVRQRRGRGPAAPKSEKDLWGRP
jgi:ribonuclease PH